MLKLRDLPFAVLAEARTISQINLMEVYACREALEGLAAFEAARHADRAILARCSRASRE